MTASLRVRPPASRGLLRLALLSAAASPAAAPFPSDPFAAGERWQHAPSAPATWIPRDVAFVGDGEFVWAAPAVGTPHVALYASAEIADPAQPLLADHAYAGAIGPVLVAAGDELDELFALAQFPAPTSAVRRTLVHGYDAGSAVGAASVAPRWTHDLGVLVNGSAALAAGADGALVLAAAVDVLRAEVLLHWLDGASGALVEEQRVAGASLRALAVSADGTRAALTCGTRTLLFELGSALPMLELPLLLPTEALALDASGTSLAVGDGAEVRVFAEYGGGFGLALARSGAKDELATRVALSDSGGVLAVGWWDALLGDAVRCEVFEVASGWRRNELVQSGAVLLQNYPVALDVSADGARVALGLWGADDARPELVLLATGVAQPLLELDLGGSVLALDLAPDGTRVALGRKDAHANLFSTTGAVVLADTGERDLQLLGATRPGGTLALAARLPEPGQALFGVGFVAGTPLVFPGIAGVLRLDPFGPLGLWSAASGPGNRADLTLVLAPDASLVGLPLAAQAASLGASGIRFTAAWVRPVVF